MSIDVIIPYYGDDPHRKRALLFVHEWLAAKFNVIVASYEGEEWVKANAIVPAIESSSAEIIVMHDADVLCDGLQEAVNQVVDGSAWAIPHGSVYRLTEESTERFYTGGNPYLDLDRPAYKGMEGGGILVTRRDTLIDIPLDPRFTGWGHEDESWAMAMWCLLGEPWRGDSVLTHLWHPPMDRKSRRMGSDANWRLRNRYARALNEPCIMKQLLQEAKDDLRASNHTDHHRQTVGL